MSRSADLALHLIGVNKQLLPRAELDAVLKEAREKGVAFEALLAERVPPDALLRVVKLRAQHGCRCEGCGELTFLLPGQKAATTPCERCGGKLGEPPRVTEKAAPPQRASSDRQAPVGPPLEPRRPAPTPGPAPAPEPLPAPRAAPLGMPRPDRFGPPPAPVVRAPRRTWGEQLSAGARDNPKAPLAGLVGVVLCVAWAFVGEPVRARGLFAGLGDASGKVVLEAGGTKHDYPVASFRFEFEREGEEAKVYLLIEGMEREPPPGTPEGADFEGQDLSLYVRGELTPTTGPIELAQVIGQQLRVRPLVHHDTSDEYLAALGTRVAVPPGSGERRVVGGTLVLRSAKHVSDGRFKGEKRWEISGTIELQLAPAGTVPQNADFDEDADRYPLGSWRGASDTFRGTFTGETDLPDRIELEPAESSFEPDPDDEGEEEGD